MNSTPLTPPTTEPPPPSARYEQAVIPNDDTMVKNICYSNAKAYLGLKGP